jgi:acetylornithine/succinyldiaminopimelate/putrescine aminotransferase
VTARVKINPDPEAIDPPGEFAMSVFLERVKASFGKKVALALNLAGLTEGEVRGEGAWVFGESGQGWLDCGSFGLHLLGHSHPEIIEQARAQLGRMGLSTRVLANLAATECAEALRATLALPGSRVLFANSGSEATEIAMKVAMHQTGRREFLSFEGGFHGKTTGAWSLSEPPRAFERCDFGRFRVHRIPLEERGAAVEQLGKGSIAGIIIEPIQGEGGIVPVSRAFLHDLAQIAREYETPLILDEVQTGLGRCGRVWCAAGDECLPDLLLVGKTLGGGLVPISAVIYNDPAGSHPSSDPLLHGSSFAGGALACKVGTTVVRLVQHPAFLAQVRSLGERCRETLRAHLRGNAHVRDIRGEGLMIGIECASPAVSAHILTESVRRRLLLSFCLHRPEVLRFYPPVVISHEDLGWALDVVVESFEGIR